AKLSLMRKPFCASTGRKHRSMTTFEHSQLTLFAGGESDTLISSPADSPVRISPQQGAEPDFTEAGPASGSNSSALSTSAFLLGLLLRTRLCSEYEALTSCSKAWKRQATPHGRSWWVLTTRE